MSMIYLVDWESPGPIDHYGFIPYNPSISTFKYLNLSNFT